MGGVMAPFILGNAVAVWGLAIIPWVEIAGSSLVFGMILLLWLGRKVSGS